MNNYSKFIVFYPWSDCQNAVQQRLLLSSTCHVTMWTIGLNVVVFVVWIGRDRNNCSTRKWSTTGHKKRRRELHCFYKDKIYLSRRCRTLELELSWPRYDFCNSAYIMWLCYLFAFAFFETPVFCVLLPISHLIFFFLDCFIKLNGNSLYILK